MGRQKIRLAILKKIRKTASATTLVKLSVNMRADRNNGSVNDHKKDHGSDQQCINGNSFCDGEADD